MTKLSKNITIQILFHLSFFTIGGAIASAEMFKLKSGIMFEGKVIERTKEYLKIDRGLGVNATYYLDEIESEGPSSESSVVSSSLNNPQRKRLSPDEYFGLRQLFENRQFEELDKSFNSFQKEFEADHLKEDKISDALSIFSSTQETDKILFDEWQKQFPNSFAPYLARAKYYRNLGWEARGGRWATETTNAQFEMMHSYFEVALRECKKALEINPQLLPAYRTIIDVYNVESNDKIEDVINDALKISPESYLIRSLIMIGFTPRWGGSYEKMEEFAKDSDQYLDKNPYLKVLRGFIYEDQGDILENRHESNNKRINTVFKNAFPLLTPMIDTLEKAAETHHEYTDEEKMKVRQAIELYSRAISFGENAGFYKDRADAYMILEDTPAALKDLKRAIELSPLNSDFYESCARIYYDNGDYKSALKFANLADRLGFSPERLVSWKKWASEYLVVLGYQAYQANNYPGAIEKLTDALKFNPSNEQSYYWRGRVKLMQNNYDLALEDFKQATKINPQYFEPYQNIGYIYAKQRRLQESLEYLNKALEIKPNDARTLYDRAHAYHLLGEDKKADIDIKKSCDLGEKEACRISASK